MSNFEEAKYHGYSAADMEADMLEAEERGKALGCDICRYNDRYHPTCENVFSGDLDRCPYRKEKE